MRMIWLKQECSQIKSTSRQLSENWPSKLHSKAAKKTVKPTACQSVCHHVVTSNGGARVHYPVKMSMHKANQSESNKIPDEWWRGERRRWLEIAVRLQTSACAPPLPEHELDKELQSVEIKRTRRKKARTGNQMTMEETEGGRVSSCYLKSVLSCLHPPFSCFTQSTLSSFLPIKPSHFPSAVLSLPLLLSRVHLWPWHPPQETLQLCLGLQRLSFTPVYSAQAECAYVCDTALWTVYEYTSAVCTFYLFIYFFGEAAHMRPVCVSSQPGHPAGDSSSITWPDSGNLWW